MALMAKMYFSIQVLTSILYLYCIFVLISITCYIYTYNYIYISITNKLNQWPYSKPSHFFCFFVFFLLSSNGFFDSSDPDSVVDSPDSSANLLPDLQRSSSS
jgi:hypothetical protein